MPFVVLVLFEDGSPASGVRVRVKRTPQATAGPRRVLNSPTIAEGMTDRNGEWQAELPAAVSGFLSLFFLDSKDVSLSESVGPFDAKQFPERLTHRLKNGRKAELMTQPVQFVDPATDRARKNRVVGAKSLKADAPSDPVDSETSSIQSGKSQKQKSQIPYAEMLRRRIERNRKLQSDLGDALGNTVRAKIDGRNARKRKVRHLMGKAPRSRTVGADKNFVSPGDDASAKMAEVRKRSQKSMQDAVSGTPGVFLPASKLPEGFKPPASGDQARSFARQLIKDLMPANAAKRRTTLLEKIRAGSRAKSAVAALRNAGPTFTSTEESTVSPATTAPPLELEALLKSVLARNGTTGAIGTRPTQASVSSDLAASQVPTGPADSVAFYDYNVLKIAWEDTWIAVIDRLTESSISELYNSIVEVVPAEKDKEKLQEELEEVDELYDLLDTIALTADALSSSLLVPSELAAWNKSIAEKWNYLDPYEQAHIQYLYKVDQYCTENKFLTYPKTAQNYLKISSIVELQVADTEWYADDPTVWHAYEADWAKTQVDEILKGAKASVGPRLGRVEEMITDLKRKISQPYRFDVFAPDSYNFGILTTYRQEWTPKNYQPGDLAGTITLAPNERRKYTLRQKAAEKSMSKNERSISASSKSELQETSRIESEITRAAQNKLNASSTAGAAGGIGVFEISGSSSLGFDHGVDSAQSKKEIRESTRKSAQEYRDDRKIELSTEVNSETELTEEREITNPNNEITVTYLFYELQRQYTVVERLYNVIPVIYVAFDVPAPHLIDEAWLLEHEWILRDVLLDEAFLPTMKLLSQDLAGDEVAVEVLEQQWKIQIAVVAELRKQLGGHVDMRDSARRSIERAADRARVAQAEADKVKPLDVAADLALTAVGGVGAFLASELLDRTGKKSTDPASATPDEAARQALDWADNDLSRAESALREAMTALEVATDKYIAAFRARLNRRVQIDALMLHVKSNIFHYMQAIWSREHPDQRYMRLYNLDIQWPGEDANVTFATAKGGGIATSTSGRPAGPIAAKSSTNAGRPGTAPAARIAAPSNSDPAKADDWVIKFGPPQFTESRKLHQIADIDDIVAFKGNYAAFRLTEGNALTAYLLQEFLDGEFGLIDPDPLGEVPTAEEAVEIAEAAWNAPDVTEEDKAEIADWLVRMFEAAYQISQEIVVPTGQLFIEALPGAHPLLEDFKLKHRAIDLQKASAEARMAEVELLRRAMRLQSGERGDPEIDKVISVTGFNGAVNVDTSA